MGLRSACLSVDSSRVSNINTSPGISPSIGSLLLDIMSWQCDTLCPRRISDMCLWWQWWIWRDTSQRSNAMVVRPWCLACQYLLAHEYEGNSQPKFPYKPWKKPKPRSYNKVTVKRRSYNKLTVLYMFWMYCFWSVAVIYRDTPVLYWWANSSRVPIKTIRN